MIAPQLPLPHAIWKESGAVAKAAQKSYKSVSISESLCSLILPQHTNAVSVVLTPPRCHGCDASSISIRLSLVSLHNNIVYIFPNIRRYFQGTKFTKDGLIIDIGYQITKKFFVKPPFCHFTLRLEVRIMRARLLFAAMRDYQLEPMEVKATTGLWDARALYTGR